MAFVSDSSLFSFNLAPRVTYSYVRSAPLIPSMAYLGDIVSLGQANIHITNFNDHFQKMIETLSQTRPDRVSMSADGNVHFTGPVAILTGNPGFQAAFTVILATAIVGSLFFLGVTKAAADWIGESQARSQPAVQVLEVGEDMNIEAARRDQNEANERQVQFMRNAALVWAVAVGVFTGLKAGSVVYRVMPQDVGIYFFNWGDLWRELGR